MSSSSEPAEAVRHAIKTYCRGVICPSEMWRTIARALTPANAASVLDSLPADVQDQLRTVYEDRPPAAYIHHPGTHTDDESFQALCVQIVNWCEAGADPARPFEPDGMIHVRVENGVVTERKPG